MSHAEKPFVVLAVLAALVAIPAAAQSTGRDEGFDAAVSQARAAVSQSLVDGALPKAFGARPRSATALALASEQKPAASCSDAKELEIAYAMTISFTGERKPQPMTFFYAGCREEPRNDYLPPYTERSYKGSDGYGLTIVTDESAESSEVLLSQGQDWAGDFGKIANAKLVSGETIAAGEVSLKEAAGAVKAQAKLRGMPLLSSPQLQACEAALATPPSSGMHTVTRDAQGHPNMGYAPAYGGGHSSTLVMSLVLLTDEAAYYYSEDCDICADVDKCDLKTHAVKNVVHAHTADCSDMKPYTKGNIVYDACAAQ